MESKRLLLLLLLSAAAAISSAADDLADDKRALLDFLADIHQGRRRAALINWRRADDTLLVCSDWTGVTCDPGRSRVVALRLPAAGLSGPFPPNTLSRLSALQILSLRSNSFSGPFPSDLLLRLPHLTALHLQFNAFSGHLPNFNVHNLTLLDLSFNRFNGTIPPSLFNLTHLSSLNLSNNSLSGPLPDHPNNLRFLNLSNNHLTGTIPRSLLNHFPSSSFSGNDFLLPPVVDPPSPTTTIIVPSSPSASPFPPKKQESRRRRMLGESEILGIAVGGFALVFIALAILMVLIWSGKRGAGPVSRGGGKASSSSKGDRSPDKAIISRNPEDDNNRLFFFDGCNLAFDLEDLLRASAEVLGKGTFGTAYKAVLEDATTVVVKRLKEVGVGKKEFEQQMEVVGTIKHDNVLDLRAYYYSKDEKLIVYDYYTTGSVSSLLHGKRGEDRTPLDWDTRLKIAIGAARGIARIHTENNGKFVHGNIKSSNVFLNANGFGCVSDLGLSSLSSNPIVPRVSRTAGYRAPEVVDVRRSTQATDVYSFGVLVLELLTGKSPIQITGGGDEIVHLVRWVQSVVREEWTAEVFDTELMRYPNIEEELVEMLQIGMSCVVRMPEQRPKMTEVVRMIEDVRRFDTVNRPSAEGGSPELAGPSQSAAQTSSPLQ